MPVKFVKGGVQVKPLQLEDFRQAFSLTKTGFKHSVGTTKGVLYVDASGKLRSANIHGGKGSVTSIKSNRELRDMLIRAFEAKNPSKNFMAAVKKRLLTCDGLDVSNNELRRSDVKDLIVFFDQENPRKKEDAGEQKSLDDFNIVQSKVLTCRDITELKATGSRKELAKICAKYEKDAANITRFANNFREALDPYNDSFSTGLTKDAENAFRKFAAALRDAADIGRMYLRQKVVDAVKAADKMKAHFAAFCKNNEDAVELFKEFRGLCENVDDRWKISPTVEVRYNDKNFRDTGGRKSDWDSIVHYETYIQAWDVEGYGEVEWDDFIQDCKENVDPALEAVIKKKGKK